MTVHEYGLILDELCHSILDLNQNIQSVSIINKYGKDVEKMIREGVHEISQEKRDVLFMHSVLETFMRKEFDE